MFGWTPRSTLRHQALLVLVLMGFESDAKAHIDMVRPEPREQGRSREPNSNLKEGPCGQRVNGRTDKVSVFAPGQTVEVTWAETTNHRSYYRVAFDVDGDDAFPTFAGSGIGAEGIDPSGPCPVDGQVILAYDMEDRSGGSHTLTVRLPDVECERCTLQVVQFMYDTMRPYYFQCADLALRRPGALDAGTADAGTADAGLDAPAASATPEPSAAPGCWNPIAPSDPRPPAPDDDDEPVAPSPTPPRDGGADPNPAPAARRSRGGCSLDPSGPDASAGALLLLGAWVVSKTRRGSKRRR